jgi:hypothetical protein
MNKLTICWSESAIYLGSASFTLAACPDRCGPVTSELAPTLSADYLSVETTGVTVVSH